MRDIFIIGSKGIPANYGGYETFVDKLTENRISENIKYHVACLSSNNEETEYNKAHCFNIKVPNIGPAKAVYYDMAAFNYCNKYIKDNNIKDAIVYVLACRIGPFVYHYKRKLHKMGGRLYINPDGHEWMRSKWNAAIRRYWKLSEKLMVKHADLLICDSENIEKYIHEEYEKYNPKTTYIAYGADVTKSIIQSDDEKLVKWYNERKVKPKEFYLVVGRFVPENNYETMIREFMNSNTEKDLVLITNVEHNAFYEQLKTSTGFDKDVRIKFVGTVYDQELLKKIREDAYGYIHGHSVGGTNPSLLEALASTDLNLLFDVGFNREVGKNSSLYWTKNEGRLATILDECDKLSNEQIREYAEKSSKEIVDRFSWKHIINEYEKILNK